MAVINANVGLEPKMEANYCGAIQMSALLLAGLRAHMQDAAFGRRRKSLVGCFTSD